MADELLRAAIIVERTLANRADEDFKQTCVHGVSPQRER
nr:hypothetical protein DO63_5362 [Burkholderia pseudomallei]